MENQLGNQAYDDFLVSLALKAFDASGIIPPPEFYLNQPYEWLMDVLSLSYRRAAMSEDV